MTRYWCCPLYEPCETEASFLALLRSGERPTVPSAPEAFFESVLFPFDEFLFEPAADFF